MRNCFLIFFFTVLCSQPTLAQDKSKGERKAAGTGEVVEMSGISIIGNRELPKTLFIVPWKNSEVGVDTDLTNTLNEGMQPVDREVFLRELEYYRSTQDN
jgi:hypothetical protein